LQNDFIEIFFIMRRIRRIIGYLYSKLLNLYYLFSSEDITCSIADLMYPRKCNSFDLDYTQFTTITRIMDIEAFINGDDSFKYQATLEKMISDPEKYNFEKDKQRFEKLIMSISRHGYDSSYKCDVQMNGYISDATHRIAVAWYFGMREIPCRLIKRHVRRNVDFFYLQSRDIRLFEDVAKRYSDWRKEMAESGWAFCCIVNGHFDTIIDYLSTLVDIITCKSQNSGNLNRCGCLFELKCPDFRIEKGKMISQTAKRVKRIVENYAKLNGITIEISLNCEEGHKMWTEFNKE